MASVVDKLRIVLEEKNAIKDVLDAKGKNPTDKLTTYKGLISELDNEEQVSYVLKASNGDRKYAQLSSRTPVTLTATANDIRQNTSAITNDGYIEGEKEIPAYHSITGQKIIPAGSSVTIYIPRRYDYSELQATISNYNNSITDSVEVVASTIENAIYEAKSTTKLADITIDINSQSIVLNVTADVKSVLRYFSMKEE